MLPAERCPGVTVEGTIDTDEGVDCWILTDDDRSTGGLRKDFGFDFFIFPSTSWKLSLPPSDWARRSDSDAPIESSVAQF